MRRLPRLDILDEIELGPLVAYALWQSQVLRGRGWRTDAYIRGGHQ